MKPWLEDYPRIADEYRDSDGQQLKYSFFYPEEEYFKEDMDAMADLVVQGLAR